MIALHIVAGAMALLAGYTAMFAFKGGPTHRRAGLVFIVTILLMGSSGAWMAAFKPDRLSLIAGLLVVYLVSTSLWTVRTPQPASRAERITLQALFALGLLVAVLGASFGMQAVQQPRHALDGYPALLYFAFGGLALMGALLDMRWLRARPIAAKHRLARHLWRMELAMYFAVSSFFLGQARLFPDALRQQKLLLMLPVLCVLVHLAWWLRKTLRATRRERVAEG